MTMSKISLIIQREYLTRVQKKSFVIMTILGPVLMAALVVVPVLLALNGEDTHDIAVVDESHLFENHLPGNENIRFHYPPYSLDSAKAAMMRGSFTEVLYIHNQVMTTTKGIQLYFQDEPGINTIRHIENAIGGDIENLKLSASGISRATIDAAKTDVRIATLKLDEKGSTTTSNTEVSMMVGMLCGILIYLFIFLYGVQVMRGVIEEKTNRVIEVIVTSVRPFELMMGKIVGIALVGLTQFALWVALSTVFITGARNVMGSLMDTPVPAVSIEQAMTQGNQLVPTDPEVQEAQQTAMDEAFAMLDNINFPLIISLFIFYFMGGYLLYSALFAAVGSAVDSEADTQQFVLPISLPIIFAFMAAQFIITNPSGPLAFWLSMIPFTSPIVMMVRIPFGVDVWQVLLSMSLLVLGFLGTTWVAGRIYRTGILMYGKKVSYQELWKWMRHS